LASKPAVIERPQIVEDDQQSSITGRGGWIVTVYNNDFNTVFEVIRILMIATKCTEREAREETWEIHHLGKSVVHQSCEAECRKIGDTISTIGIKVEITSDN